jgi:hypothetical protein
MVVKLATDELVAVAFGKWALARAGLTAPVVTTLPDVSGWASTGAVQVTGVTGTTTHDTPLHDVVVSYEGWAARPGSDKPPWGQANGLLAGIADASYADWWDLVVPLTLEPAGVYQSVVVQGAIVLMWPRRLADPDASRAHYSMDLRLIWTVA